MSPFLPLFAQDTARLDASLLPDFSRVLPEVFLSVWILVILAVDLVRGRGAWSGFPKLSMIGCLGALALVFVSTGANGAIGYGGFGAMEPDAVARIFKVVFLVTGFLTVLFVQRTRGAWGDEPELHVLLFGALAGMCYLASATELVGAYLAFETVSYTGFLMAGYRTDDPKGAEAGGKFVMFGAVSSAVMLFGLSLVYGLTGTTQLVEIARILQASEAQPALYVAAVFVFAGFAFKAAAFPMQFWCPDVYEGAPAPVAAFLAVASKAAVFAIGIRVLMLGGNAAASPDLSHLLPSHAPVVQTILVLAAIATMTWGNFAALRQKNLQRMLAYSSIAHAGYLLMTAAVVVPGEGGRDAVAAILVYFVLYLLMTLAAFFVAALLRRDTGTADISALRGAGAQSPVLALSFAIVLFSLTGLPPTAGFIGKLLLFAPVVHQGFYILAAVGLLNGAVSLYYYAKPLREMYLADNAGMPKSKLALGTADNAIMIVLAAPLLVLGIVFWDRITQAALDAVRSASL